MRIKLVWTLPILVLALVFGGALETYAGTEHSGRGWLWGGSNGDNFVSVKPSYLGWISMNNVDENGVEINGPISYGVNIPPSDGALSGYAWTDSYGWISFNAADLAGCPLAAPTRSGNALTGGARFLSMRDGGVNNGGWAGCISLSGVSNNGTPYGVTIDPATGKMSGSAWHGEKDLGGGLVEGLGFIDFSYATVVASKSLKICPSSVTMLQGSTQKLELFYDTRADCSGPEAPILVSALAWSTSAPSVVSLSSLGGTSSTIATGASAGTSTVTATYGTYTATASITITALVACTCDASVAATICTGVPFTSNTTPASCNIPASCTGSMVCGGKWKEVAPNN